MMLCSPAKNIRKYQYIRAWCKLEKISCSRPSTKWSQFRYINIFLQINSTVIQFREYWSHKYSKNHHHSNEKMKSSKKFAFLLSFAILISISQETNVCLGREISQIIKPPARGFIIFIRACGSASFELFRVLDESHIHKGRGDIWGNSS